MPRPVLPLALAASGALLLLLPSSAGAVAGRDLLEPDAGTDTAATAQRLTFGATVDQRVVLGPTAVRDEDFFVARGTAGSAVTIRLQHGGEVDGRPLVLGVPRTVGGALRWRRARSGEAIVAQARIGADGRLLLEVRCGAAGAACSAPGAIPYRLEVARTTTTSGRATTRTAAAARRKPSRGVRRKPSRRTTVRNPATTAPARGGRPAPAPAPTPAPAEPQSGGTAPTAPAPTAPATPVAPDSGGTPLA
ncbi:hypothetical protein [Patulibacter defluvii]|uniref:hypothetical protein n=1 Tax=Patulibacter defluvii TaxID=3095358 RepID=UPI002A750C5E|nr:hypothetical protein [Patulibacter sp. DM4]